MVTRGIGSTGLATACELAGNARAAQATSEAPRALLALILPLLMSNSLPVSLFCACSMPVKGTRRGLISLRARTLRRGVPRHPDKPARGGIDAVSANWGLP